MKAKLTIDKAGRIVLPKPLRDELNLSPGDSLELESSADKVTLHPVRPAPLLQKERGIWVYRTGEKLSASVVDDTMRRVREERDRTALGDEP
jgi:AbrB family looped-hinge helix DNA binding protein